MVDKGEFYAHSREGDSSRENWQRLKEHLTGVGELAKNFAAVFGAENFAWIAGLLHDLGKYSDEFQDMLDAANAVDAHIEGTTKSHKKRVDHSTAGAQHAEKLFAHANMGRLLAYVIAGHHAGLPNGSDGAEGGSSLEARLRKKIPAISPPEDFLQLLKHEALELKDLPFTPDKQRLGFQLGFFIRMLYSALVDADFLDTEAFCDSEKASRREGYPTLAELEGPLFTELERVREKAGPSPSKVNRLRADVLQDCLAAAQRDPGLFSLTVPTGGGKTLSSLAFGIRHALKHGLRRIIYVIPFTSIIEQNAAVFRKIFAKAGLDAVIEHHSNFEPKEKKEEEEEYRRYRLACENWDAPIIVTTNVQFFESLFASRSSRCRKLHNIAGSVVILDEVQTLPAQYLKPCIETLRELSQSYHTSIVLCSATQPALQVRDDFREGLENVREIISDPAGLFADMKRVEVQPLFDTSHEKLAREKLPDEQLAAKISSHEQVLCVVNTRKHARIIFERIRETGGAYHLSALMCPAHRTKIFDEIRAKIEADEPCRVVSTQLIEAGVDIDFPAVYRAMAGIDSIAQAAGRCNREGKQESGTVYIFNPESGIPPGFFRETAQTAEGVIRHFPDDILCLDAIEEFFRGYYWSRSEGDRLDEKHILRELSAGAGNGNFSFKKIAGDFRFIENECKPVIIPWGEDGKKLVEKIRKSPPDYSFNRKAQRFTVQIYPDVWNSLVAAGCVEILHDQYPVLIQEDLYQDDLGLCPEDPRYYDIKTLTAV